MAQDDYSGDVNTTGVVVVGGSVSGSLETSGDRDWFKVHLQAGSSYYFTLAGSATGQGTLRDPMLYLYDGAGQSLTQNDDSGGQLDSRIVYTASHTGDYYLAAGAYNDAATGTYQLAAGTYVSDYPSTAPGSLEVGGSLAGEIKVKGDIDWIKTDFTAGTTYTISLRGVDSGQGTLADPYLYLYDGDGKLIARDDDGSGRRDSLLYFTPTASGSYYLGLGAYNDASTGTFKVSLSAQVDDQAAGTGTQGSLSMGSSVQGNLEKAGDRDWFGVQLSAGHTYYFDLQGLDTSQGTLADPYLYLYDNNGSRLAWDDDGGRGLNARVLFTPTADGTYYLGAAGFDDGQMGTYQLGAHELPGSDAAGTGRITSFGVLEGEMEKGQHDWIPLALEAATTYMLLLEGQGDSGLPNPSLDLLDAYGGRLATGQTDASSGAARLVFTPDQSGTYYVDAGATGNNDAGRYLLSIVGRQVADFLSQPAFGNWSATDLFEPQGPAWPGLASQVGYGSRPGVSAMADPGQSPVAGLGSGSKDATAGVLTTRS